jgi:hypothetical protein
MTPDLLRAELDRLGITQRALSVMIDANYRTVRRWCSGDMDIPKAVMLLLEGLDPEDASDLIREARRA